MLKTRLRHVVVVVDAAPDVALRLQESTIIGCFGLFPPWPGQSTQRDIEAAGDDFRVGTGVLDFGIFNSESDAVKAASMLLAGMPQQQSLKISFTVDDNGFLVLAAVSDTKTTIGRSFGKKNSGYDVEHSFFFVDEQFRQTGCAKRMLRASLEYYDFIGVKRINTTAMDDDGGYIWAKAGFSPTRPTLALSAAALGCYDIPYEDTPLALSVLHEGAPDELMWRLSKLRNDAGLPIGKMMLRGKTWEAFADLTNTSHRTRLAEFLGA